MREYPVEGHESSLVSEGKQWKLVFSEEFDGKQLDTGKWDFRRSIMGVEHKGWSGAETIELDGNSNCVFHIVEKDGEVTSAQMQTGHNFMDAVRDVEETRYSGGLSWPIAPLKPDLYLHAHGYYECRCRLQQMLGWWSAFWIQSPTIGASLDPTRTGIEIDIMESFKPGNIIPHYLHWGGYGTDHKDNNTGAGADLALDEYHLFGVEWSEKGYTFYIDGKEDGHLDGPVSNCPEFILIGTEVQGYRKANHAPIPEAYEAAAAGDTFVVDHIRVFDVE